MKIPFTLVDNNGNLVTGQAEEVVIQISKDCCCFYTLDVEVNEIGHGCYYTNIPSRELNCQDNVIIRITADNCQDTVLEYTPANTPAAIAKAVWEAQNRTLTSLNTGSTKAVPFVTTSLPVSASSKPKYGLSVSQVLGGK